MQREYILPHTLPAQCGVSDKGKYLLGVTKNNIRKYDNETGLEIWHKEIMEGVPMSVVLSKDGKYGLIQFHPNVVYLIDENSTILKQWDLETETHHPTAPSFYAFLP